MSFTVVHAHFRLNRQLPTELFRRGGKVQEELDNAVIRYCRPYTPKQTGVLESSPQSATAPGSGQVIWPGPYARYLYYGKLMTDVNGRVSVKKGEKKPIVTNIDLTYNTDLNEDAGAFWFERMKADHQKEIVEEVESFARSELAKR